MTVATAKDQEAPPHPGAPEPEIGRLPADLRKSHHEIERLRGELVRLEHADFDITAISEKEFTAALAKDKLRQERIEKIVKNRLEEGKHYGKVPSVQKDFLWQTGAQALRQIFRYTLRQPDPPVVTVEKDLVSVIVTVGVFDALGRLLCTRSGSCNTKEKRFQSKRDGWIYKDPREQLHNCLAMAEKRAGVLATLEATGASAIFANADELDRVTDPEEDAGALGEPWSEAEKTAVYKAAKAQGIATLEQFKQFVQDELGRGFVGTGADVQRLLSALEDPSRRGVKPVASSEDPFTDPEV